MCLPRSHSIVGIKEKAAVVGGEKAHLLGVCKQWVIAKWNGPAVIKQCAKNCMAPAGCHEIKKYRDTNLPCCFYFFSWQRRTNPEPAAVTSQYTSEGASFYHMVLAAAWWSLKIVKLDHNSLMLFFLLL